MPVPGQQRREPLGQIMALVRSEIEVVIDLPENEPVGIAIEREGRAAGEEDEQSRGTPRPRTMPPCLFRLLYRGVRHGSCCYVLKSSAVNQGAKRAEERDKRETRDECLGYLVYSVMSCWPDWHMHQAR